MASRHWSPIRKPRIGSSKTPRNTASKVKWLLRKLAALSIKQRLDGERMIEVGEAQAKRLIEVERAAATAHAARILAHASGELERERYRVRRELLEETVDRAHRKAQELAKRDIDATRQQALVEQAISYLERSHA